MLAGAVLFGAGVAAVGLEPPRASSSTARAAIGTPASAVNSRRVIIRTASLFRLLSRHPTQRPGSRTKYTWHASSGLAACKAEPKTRSCPLRRQPVPGVRVTLQRVLPGTLTRAVRFGGSGRLWRPRQKEERPWGQAPKAGRQPEPGGR